MFNLIKKIIDFLNNLDKRGSNGGTDPVTIDQDSKDSFKKLFVVLPVLWEFLQFIVVFIQ